MKTLKTMAKIFYEVKQVKGTLSRVYGKWFGHVKQFETLDTRKMANHIAEHGSIYTQDVVFGVLEKFRSCLLEMLLDSKKVKIDGIGTFYAMIENTKGGTDTKEDYNPREHIKGLHIRFLPELAAEMNISSKEFLKKAEFINIDLVEKPKKSDDEEDDNGGGDGNG